MASQCYLPPGRGDIPAFTPDTNVSSSDRRAATHAGLVALINEESKTTYATPPWIVAHRSRDGTDRHVVGGVA